MAKTTEKWFKKGYLHGFRDCLIKIGGFIDTIAGFHFSLEPDLQKKFKETLESNKNNAFTKTLHSWISELINDENKLRFIVAEFIKNYNMDFWS